LQLISFKRLLCATPSEQFMITVMMFGKAAPWAFLAAAIGPAVAQFDAWQDGQISTEICIWKQPRGENIVVDLVKALPNVYLAIMIRDMVYLDGGDIKWTATMNDGQAITGLDTGWSFRSTNIGQTNN
jgi:hypothetical protein